MDGSSARSAQHMSQEAEKKKAVSGKDRRRGSKLFIEATKKFEKGQFDAAMRDYERATALDPENANYSAAAKVPRSHAVVELIQVAAKARMQSDSLAESAALQRAAELDPQNDQVAEHLHAMADDSVASQPK